MKEGLRHKVLKDKYFTTSSVVSWLRCSPIRTLNVSSTWRSLVKSLDGVTHRLAWNPGTGHSIRIGEDEILGLGNNSLLSLELIITLQQRSIYYLYQARGSGRTGVVLAQWKSSEEMGIIGEEVSEWDHYYKTLVNSGILLTDRLYKLIWTGGDRSGNISTKNVYDVLASKIWNHNKSLWHRSLWDWDLAPKIKLFTWLMMEDKILTQDNLQRRGWSRPSICSVCLQDLETVLHLMLQCGFTQ